MYGVYAAALAIAQGLRKLLGRRGKGLFSAEIGTALSPFRSLPYIRMYGKVSKPFFLIYIDHIVTAICQFVEVQLYRGS
jgi:hypothetical protein